MIKTEKSPKDPKNLPLGGWGCPASPDREVLPIFSMTGGFWLTPPLAMPGFECYEYSEANATFEKRCANRVAVQFVSGYLQKAEQRII